MNRIIKTTFREVQLPTEGGDPRWFVQKNRGGDVDTVDGPFIFQDWSIKCAENRQRDHDALASATAQEKANEAISLLRTIETNVTGSLNADGMTEARLNRIERNIISVRNLMIDIAQGATS